MPAPQTGATILAKDAGWDQKMARRKARRPNRNGLEQRSPIRQRDAVRLIAMEVRALGEGETQACNRVSKRIGYAVKVGKLPRLGPGTFEFGRLAAWAQDTWPGKFLDWPVSRSHVATLGASTLRVPAFHVTGTVHVTRPDTVVAWRSYAASLEAEIRKLTEEIQLLRQENDILRHDVKTLRPYKLRADETRVKRQAAGKKGGRGRIREN